MSKITNERWLHTGSVELESGKTGVAFEVLGEKDSRTGRVHFYAFKRSFAVGSVYSVDAERDGDTCRVTASTMQFIKMHHDATAVVDMQAAELAFKQRMKAAAMEAKARKQDLPDSLAVCARAYSRLPYGAQAAFEQVLIAQLRKTARRLEREQKD